MASCPNCKWGMGVVLPLTEYTMPKNNPFRCPNCQKLLKYSYGTRTWYGKLGYFLFYPLFVVASVLFLDIGGPHDRLEIFFGFGVGGLLCLLFLGRLDLVVE